MDAGAVSGAVAWPMDFRARVRRIDRRAGKAGAGRVCMVTLSGLSAAYAACVCVLVLADLAVVAGTLAPFGRHTLGGAVFDRLNLPAAVLLYLIYTSGLVFFSVWPALALRRAWLAPVSGFGYGAAASVGFALTSLRLREPIRLADLARHGVLAAVAALCGMMAADGMMM